MRRFRLGCFAIIAAACGSKPTVPAEPGEASPPATTATATAADAAGALAASPCPADPAAATADSNLMAIVSHGEALPDHVGPDRARAIFADLDRDAARYLDRFACRFVSPTAAAGYDSLLLAVPLWRLRKHDLARVQELAARIVMRYEELARTPPDPAVDPYFAQRVAGRVAEMSFIRDGLDVPAGPSWRVIAAADVDACITAAPDGTTAIRVTRSCSCGETLSCRATVAGAALAIDVRWDPASPAMCTDCYPTSTSCTLPALPPRATVTLAPGKTWTTDDRGLPIGVVCR